MKTINKTKRLICLFSILFISTPSVVFAVRPHIFDPDEAGQLDCIRIMSVRCAWEDMSHSCGIRSREGQDWTEGNCVEPEGQVSDDFDTDPITIDREK